MISCFKRLEKLYIIHLIRSFYIIKATIMLNIFRIGVYMKKETVLISKKLDTELKLRGFSKQTSKMYLFYNDKFLEFIKKSPEDIEDEDIKEFLAYKMSEDSLS